MSSTDAYYAAPAPVARRRNVPGIVSISAAALGTLLGLIQQLLPYFLFEAVGISGYSTVLFGFSIVLGLLALVSIGFGVAGLVIRDAPRALAAAGTALGVATLLSILVGVLAGFVAEIAR